MNKIVLAVALIMPSVFGMGKKDIRKLRILHNEIGALTNQIMATDNPSEQVRLVAENEKWITDIVKRSTYFIEKYPTNRAAQSLRNTRDPMAQALQKLNPTDEDLTLDD